MSNDDAVIASVAFAAIWGTDDPDIAQTIEYVRAAVRDRVDGFTETRNETGIIDSPGQVGLVVTWRVKPECDDTFCSVHNYGDQPCEVNGNG